MRAAEGQARESERFVSRAELEEGLGAPAAAAVRGDSREGGIGATALAERMALIAVLFLFTFGGYYAIGLHADPSVAHTLRTPLDDAIPFLPVTIYLYLWIYTAMLYPAFTIRCRGLFRRVAVAYAVAVSVCLLTFALFPVTSLGFRPDLTQLPDARFHEWGVRLNFMLDPPFNLFPSLHVAAGTLAALAAAKARRAYGALGAIVLGGVCIAVCTVKQHYLADAVAGIALGIATYAIVLRPFPVRHRIVSDVAFGWTGPASYLGFHAAVMLALYALFRAGLRPWAS